MTDADPLRHLRSDLILAAGTTPRDVAEIHRRARAIRAGRRLRTGTVSVVGLAAALVVAGVVVPQHPDAGGGTSAAVYLGVTAARAADGTAVDCRVGFGSHLALADVDERADVAALAALLREGTDAPPLRRVSARQDEGQCPPPMPALVLYDVSEMRGVSVYPDVADAYEGQAGIVDIPVRGSSGQLLELFDGSHVLSWTEPDGERWLAESNGVKVEQLVDVLDGMQIDDDDDTVTADPPKGFELAPVLPPTDDTVVPGWGVRYGDAQGPPSESVTLGVRPAHTPTAAYLSRSSGFTPTDVGGSLALYQDHPEDESGTLFWDDGGQSYVLVATGGPERLVELAEAVEPVAVDDQRVVSAFDPGS